MASQEVSEVILPLDESIAPKDIQAAEETIAFGVMYYPRPRIQRIEDLNCDNRLLREDFPKPETVQKTDRNNLNKILASCNNDNKRLGLIPKNIKQNF